MDPCKEHSIGPNGWEKLRDTQFVEQLLTALAEPARQGNQPNSVVWQNALFRFADCLDQLMVDNHPKAKSLLSLVKTQFPAIISPYKLPLAVIQKNPVVSPALLQICSRFALLAQNDEILTSNLKRHDFIKLIAHTWFVETPIPSHRFRRSSDSVTDSIVKITGGNVAFRLVVKQQIAVGLASKVFAGSLVRELKSSAEVEEFQMIGLELIQLPGIPKRMLEDRIPFKIIELSWRAVQSDIEYQAVSNSAISCYIWFIGLLLRNLPPNVQEGSAKEMVQAFDIIDLCAKKVYRAARSSDPSDTVFPFANPPAVETLLLLVAQACKGQRELTDSYVQPILTRTKDLLRGLDEKTYQNRQAYLAVWDKFIQACGLDERKLRKAELDKDALGVGFRGCSWYQCILAGGEPEGAAHRPMLLDSNCMKVQYCCMYCQRRDWYDGGHKEVCNSGF